MGTENASASSRMSTSPVTSASARPASASSRNGRSKGSRHVGTVGERSGTARRCCMKTLCGWGSLARTSRDPPQESHDRDAVEGPSRLAQQSGRGSFGCWPVGRSWPVSRAPPSPVSGGRRADPLSHRQMRILSVGLVGWPRTAVWSAASGGAETSSQFRAGRRRAPFRPTSATITGERARFGPLAPPVAVWAALCGGVAGVWPRRRGRAPWAGGGRGGERVSSARGCASCPSPAHHGAEGG